MALLFSILSSLLDTGFNTKRFGAISLGFSMLKNYGGKERKRHDLAEE